MSTRFLRAAVPTVTAALTLSLAGPVGAAPPPTPAGDPQARAAATAGGTIAFIRGYDVWLARGNGSSQYRVTSDGTAARPYRSPSMSDTGVLAVGHGKDIVRMTQNGTVLNRIDPPPLVGPPDTPAADVAISPDGSHIAYTLAAHQCDLGQPGCRPSVVTAITRSDRATPATTYGITPYWSPSWVGIRRTLQTGGYLHHVTIKDLGQEPVHWFDDQDTVPAGTDTTDLGDSELSADGQWLAAVRGYGDQARITWYRVNGDPRTGPPPAAPTWTCATTPLTGINGPTWGPDSRTFAWEEPGDGIWSTRVTPVGAPCQDPGRLIADGGQPDWSAAALAPAPRRYSVRRAPAVAGKVRIGRTLRARSAVLHPRPGSVRLQWLRSGKPVRGATKAAYRLTRKDRGKRISVRVTARGTGYATATLTSRPTRKVRR
ncbi:MAG TPA: hypothetical protein VMF51_12880 [Nocardioides sp.]|uniref:hypothetical protein n=1 Tax=Nocardioides sp. TaxID=35761 RepID=UPI002BF4BD3F|nr:hypothetical protein [Nocardioides sp.]HTW16021.1 hypothetical protein [Nocardioides sp.]